MGIFGLGPVVWDRVPCRAESRYGANRGVLMDGSVEGWHMVLGEWEIKQRSGTVCFVIDKWWFRGGDNGGDAVKLHRNSLDRFPIDLTLRQS